MMMEISDEDLQELYAWIDVIPLSRPKRNIHRDFSDGVMCAEVVKHFYPKLIELHNYTPANSTQQKMDNWKTLNHKVFNKLNFYVPEDVIRSIAISKAGVVEVVLSNLRVKLDQFQLQKRVYSDGRRGPNDMTGNLNGYHQSDDDTLRLNLPPDSETQRYQVHRTGAAKKTAATQQSSLSNSKIRSQSLTNLHHLEPEVRLLVEEKEQALLVSQETIQILNAKVRRLEHLLQLKDLRIDEVQRRLQHYEPNS